MAWRDIHGGTTSPNPEPRPALLVLAGSQGMRGSSSILVGFLTRSPCPKPEATHQAKPKKPVNTPRKPLPILRTHSLRALHQQQTPFPPVSARFGPRFRLRQITLGMFPPAKYADFRADVPVLIAVSVFVAARGPGWEKAGWHPAEQKHTGKRNGGPCFLFRVFVCLFWDFVCSSFFSGVGGFLAFVRLGVDGLINIPDSRPPTKAWLAFQHSAEHNSSFFSGFPRWSSHVSRTFCSTSTCLDQVPGSVWRGSFGVFEEKTGGTQA